MFEALPGEGKKPPRSFSEAEAFSCLKGILVQRPDGTQAFNLAVFTSTTAREHLLRWVYFSEKDIQRAKGIFEDPLSSANIAIWRQIMNDRQFDSTQKALIHQMRNIALYRTTLTPEGGGDFEDGPNLVTEREIQRWTASVVQSWDSSSEKYQGENGDQIQSISEVLGLLKYVTTYDPWTDREFVLKMVTEDGRNLKLASQKLKRDPEVVLMALSHYDYALNYADSNLTDDPEFILTAIQENPKAFLWADVGTQLNKNFAMRAVGLNSRVVEYLNPLFLSNYEEIVLEAVQSDPWVLEYTDLRQDPDFMLKAIKINPTALHYASSELQVDREFVLSAMKTNGAALEWIHPIFKGDHEIALTAIREKRSSSKVEVGSKVGGWKRIF